MTTLTPKVFVDFDGTITREDVGNAFFRKFGDETASLAAVAKWKTGDLSGADLLRLEAESMVVTENAALRFVESFEIDPAFKTFYSFCSENEIQLTILSDGLAFYIERILNANGLDGIRYLSNSSQFVDGGIRIEFPFQSSCTKCGNCKGNQILANSGADDLIVYIGNGFSDRCAVQYADMVFAKDDLLKYCEENNITYFPFNDFEDVLAKFRKVLAKGKFKKRHRAELKRREAYLAE